ncbi:MAG: hypothetical protein RLP44_00930 [Aggregatilineales bacterium]
MSRNFHTDRVNIQTEHRTSRLCECQRISADATAGIYYTVRIHLLCAISTNKWITRLLQRVLSEK